MSIRRIFINRKKWLAYELNQPRLEKITFHSIRRWHGTVYCFKNGLLKTQIRLGHRSILNTMKYVHMAEAYFKDIPIKYDARSANTDAEFKELISKGFEHVMEQDGVHYFRKAELM